jgi:hypothetical protein
MDDRRVVSETAQQLAHYSHQIVLEPGLGWAVQVDAATAAPVVPVAVEPEPEVTGALAELKVVLDELVREQRKKYDQYEAQLNGLSDTEKAALYAKKGGKTFWDATIGDAVGIVKALPGFAAGYFKTLCKIAMLPSELAAATARSIATGDMAPLKAEADKFVQPLVNTYDQAVHYKGVLVTLYEDEQTMGLLNYFAEDYWDATHPLERTEMGASAAADIVVTILLALVTAGVGAAANIAAKSARLAKAVKLLDKIAGMLRRTGHRNSISKREINASDLISKANEASPKAAKARMADPETPNRSTEIENDNNSIKIVNDSDKLDDSTKTSPILKAIPKYETKPMSKDYIGEETGAVWGTKVHYLSETERFDYLITIKNGKLIDSKGGLFDTSDASSVFAGGNGNAIYVMDECGNIFASKSQVVGKFHHSSFLAGEPVAAAGEISVKDGIIDSVTRRSGHYMPDAKHLQQFVAELEEQNIFLKGGQIGDGF